jgi:hypothetical protein
MRESNYQTQLLTHLRINRRWEVLKHADQFTSGIPDVSVSLVGDHRTVWLELKVLQKPSQALAEPKTFVDNQVQLATAVRLAAFYVVHDPFRSWTMMVQAKMVARHLETGFNGLQLPQPGFVASGTAYRLVMEALGGILR